MVSYFLVRGEVGDGEDDVKLGEAEDETPMI